MKYLLILWSFLTVSFNVIAQKNHNCLNMANQYKMILADDSRSDSINVLHTHLEFDFTDFSSLALSAKAEISLEAKLDEISTVNLDLLNLTVDSVLHLGNQIDFNQSTELLSINFSEPFDSGELFELNIYYQGSPTVDDSGWGGFYWNTNYAYNLGVGFDADPHNYGRAWFPCFDNFIERCTFSVNILASDGKRGISNGELVNETETEDGNILTEWHLDLEIPSYLASIAVAEYDYNTSSFTSISNEEIPIWLVAPESSVSNVNNSFIHLEDALHGFEESYGAYAWNRVGYVFVPFGSGAMEHATNIAYPISFAGGDLNFETLMAHELAHHWWGDLITCSSAEDMWINEGMASFSEGLFLEQLYGNSAFYEWISDNLRNVLLNAHEDDGGYIAISGISHANTYGSHVYNKGANVGSCLRSYMGIEAFEEACAAFMTEYALQSVSSEDMRDFFQSFTSENLTSFFDDWVFNPGFTDFSLDDYEVTPDGDEFLIDMSISQRLHEAPSYFNNMPISVTFISESDEETQRTVHISGGFSDVQTSIPFEPDHIILNRNYELTPAILAEEKVITDTGIDNFSYSEFRSDTDILNEGDSIWMRVECHFTGPHEVQPQVEYVLSTDRFWRVIGDFPESSEVSARIRYYGDPGGLFGFDVDYFQLFSENALDEFDLVLLYRPNGNTPWSEHEDYEINEQGNEFDFSGRIDFNNLKEGDYVWAFATGETSVEEYVNNSSLYPNPASEYIVYKHKLKQNGLVKVFSQNGQLVYQTILEKQKIEIQTKNWSPGTYTLNISNLEGKLLDSQKFNVNP